jgi:hypothetical protein
VGFGKLIERGGHTEEEARRLSELVDTVEASAGGRCGMRRGETTGWASVGKREKIRFPPWLFCFSLAILRAKSRLESVRSQMIGGLTVNKLPVHRPEWTNPIVPKEDPTADITSSGDALSVRVFNPA